MTPDEPIDLEAVRAASLKKLDGLGFTVAELPLNTDTTLRPPREIAARLMALDALLNWCSLHLDAEDAEILGYADVNSLQEWMTDEEREWFKTSRQEARDIAGTSIGWHEENMWPLAWVLGMTRPPLLDGEFIGPDVAEAIVTQLLPSFDVTVDDVLKTAKVRPVRDVITMHDLFYCAHNAVRNSQLGREGVPMGFDPFAGGGTVHERRHSLTWCLSPGVVWDDTELST